MASLDKSKLTPQERIEIIDTVRGELPVDYSTEMTVIPLEFEEQSNRIPVIIPDREKIFSFFGDFYTKKGMCTILYKTTAEWNADTSLKGAKNTIYVYLDKYSYVNEEGETIYVPGIKLGDGNAYLIDKPFILDAAQDWIMKHIQDTSVHIQPGEREFWNNKLNYIDPSDDLLEFTRE